MPAPIVLTRRELYDLVWSKPMRDLAAELGISDVGLAKVCDRHRVPKPERGHWNKIQAGQKTKKAVFVESDDAWLNRIEIKGALSQIPEAARKVIEDAKTTRKAQVRKIEARLSGPVNPVAEPHKSILRTAKVLRKGPADRNNGVHALGEGLCGVVAAANNVERAIAFLDALARALEARGLPLTPKGQTMGVSRNGDEAIFTLKERTRQQKHVPTEEELAAESRRQQKLEKSWRSPGSWPDSLYTRAYPDFDTVYTGEFALQVEGYSDGVRRKWADGKTQTVESLLDDIVTGIEALLAARKAAREDREERQRVWEELSRRRDLARQRKEREDKRLSYVRSVMDMSDEADRLRRWLDRPEVKRGAAGTDYASLVAWVKQRISNLDDTLDPSHIDGDLRAKKLFPEVDDLGDPLGEPPSEPRYW